MSELYYQWHDIEEAANAIVLQMYKDKWRPDYIVGVTKSGSVVATMLSYKLDITMHSLDVSEDLESCESNLWMPEDAVGYVDFEEQEKYGARWDPGLRKNILIINDVNLSGKTFNWIKEDWEGSCLPDNREMWDSVWHKNVRFASIIDYEISRFEDVDYKWHLEFFRCPDPIVFPWHANAKSQINRRANK